jgi:hypothetical protein
MGSVNAIGGRPENCYAGRACGKPAAEQPSASGSTAQATAVNLSQSRSSDITLVTAEGDTVTLSASQTMEMSFETYSSKGVAGSAAGVSAEVRQSREFSLTIDGDLNREELKDIRKAIRTLVKAERDVLKGHEERATERTARLQDLDQLISIDARMEFRQAVSVTKATVETPASEAQTPVELPLTEVVVLNADPVEQPETQELEEPASQATAPATPAPSPVQRFTVAAFENQQQFTFQYLWDGGRPVAVQSPGIPTLSGSQPVA